MNQSDIQRELEFTENHCRGENPGLSLVFDTAYIFIP